MRRVVAIAVLVAITAGCSPAPSTAPTTVPAGTAPATATPEPPATLTPTPTAVPLPVGRIAFVRTTFERAGAGDPIATSDVYIVDADGSNLQRLTDDAKHDLHVYWLADGSRLVTVWEQRNDPYRQYLASMRPDGSDRRELGLVQEYSDPVISPDGRYVAFGGDGAEEGETGIALLDLVTGERIQLSTDGATGPLWSPDSRAVVAQLPSRRVLAYSVPDGRPLLDVEGEVDALYGWTPDGSAVLYRVCSFASNPMGCEGGPVSMARFDGSTPTTFTAALPRVPYGSVSPDGRWIATEAYPLVRVVPAAEAELVLWPAAAHTPELGDWTSDSAWFATPVAREDLDAGAFIGLVSPGLATVIAVTDGVDSAPAWEPR